ncbi:hypothetical protein Mapa_009365 [Marchantia paleacea]|nr:hypothetical protein Mapa_009365 [Marchantia paleacea]
MAYVDITKHTKCDLCGDTDCVCNDPEGSQTSFIFGTLSQTDINLSQKPCTATVNTGLTVTGASVSGVVMALHGIAADTMSIVM